KPAVVEHTGPSRFLPEAEGLLRFRNIDEAAAAIEAVESDYERHCRLARELAEGHFDGAKVVRRVLELALACAGWRSSATARSGRRLRGAGRRGVALPRPG